ncbi:P-loop NTPase [Methermicoccus shengliensis]|uniref:P-loop NTPase n=1 Tax=Methermicoccus shengliensis TaxID=660064 RepID=A0A832RWF6_9EURY|nr:P-loop NTPase [Methermicoccus shengliensis]KUK05130.1 MAG: Carbon monoxide dehydrogenase accessory protein [Euryarchaeota archaeon 55_53]KUK30696.1 MAG: Carbon monoxide dehydrogenase accessory protein [Methanosarcinales archeaon 56_1174]MDI3487290.1 dehydrogenase maturation factor [Methanosarcinales archaeon]MDN5294635.1 dehydrogenase maturation factor [Methanosarcinales archaeon]HIH69342.1 P-loop NTPase [Methermicoccus shengliensis]
MKILVCGKGGCGKSVVAALIAKELAKRGKKVLVVDTDESNFGIYRNFGVEQPRDFMEFLGGKEKVRERLLSFLKSGEGEKTRMPDKISLNELPKDFTAEKDGIKVIAIGKIHEFGEGCACPMGAVAREFLQALKLGEDEFVVVDTDAGIEHFGRGVEAGGDVVVAVIEPSYESIRLAEKIVELSRKIGKRVVKVGNKVDESSKEFVKADAYLPLRKEIQQACLLGEELPLVDEARGIVDAILER